MPDGTAVAGRTAARREALRGHAAMLAFSALVAGSFALGALAAPLISPAALNAARFVIAAAILLTAAAATRGIPRAAAQAPWRYLVLGGLLAAYFVAMFEGLKTAPPVSAAAVFTLTPILALGFGRLFARQRATLRIALALALGAAGALWVIFRADLSALLAFEIGRGEWIYFWGCVAHAAYAPLVPRLNRGESALVFSAGTISAGALLLLVWAARAIVATDWAALPPVVWITLAYISVIASALTFVLVQYASMRLPAAKVMAYTYLTPVWVILWQAALGRPLPDPLVLAGVGLTAVALLLLLAPD